MNEEVDRVTKIRKVMAKALEYPEEHITVFTNQDNVDNWDSIHHVKMIVLLEREFNIVIPDVKVGNMISYKLIEDVINECIGNGSGKA